MHGTARRVVAVALRTAILGVRAGRRRRVARPRDFGEKPGAGKAVLARGSARGRPAVDAGARRRHGEKQRGGRRDGGEGNFVINSKFQIPVCKLRLSPSSWPQMKNF